MNSIKGTIREEIQTQTPARETRKPIIWFCQYCKLFTLKIKIKTSWWRRSDVYVMTNI